MLPDGFRPSSLAYIVVFLFGLSLFILTSGVLPIVCSISWFITVLLLQSTLHNSISLLYAVKPISAVRAMNSKFPSYRQIIAFSMTKTRNQRFYSVSLGVSIFTADLRCLSRITMNPAAAATMTAIAVSWACFKPRNKTSLSRQIKTIIWLME